LIVFLLSLVEKPVYGSVKSRWNECSSQTKKCHEVFVQISVSNVCSDFVAGNIRLVVLNVLASIVISDVDPQMEFQKWYGFSEWPCHHACIAHVADRGPLQLLMWLASLTSYVVCSNGNGGPAVCAWVTHGPSGVYKRIVSPRYKEYSDVKHNVSRNRCVGT
jgi:hypothetical protein